MTAPNYQRIADDVRRKIRSGDLTPGDRLPTAVDLAKQWKVSGAVVTQALGTLKAEGLLASAAGRGTFVLEPRKLLTWALSDFEQHRNDSYSADAWAVAVQKQGMKPSADVTVRRVQASAAVAEWLEVSEGETVIVRDRVRYADGQPYMVSTSFFPSWVAAGTRLEEPGDQAAPGGLLAEAGHPQLRVRDRVTAPVVAGDEARSLGVPEGSKVWSVVRIGYGNDERPVRAMRTLAPLDVWQLEFGQTVRSHEVSSPFLCSDYSPDPYPGQRPDVSFVEQDGAAWVVRSDDERPGQWCVDIGSSMAVDMDEWLARQGAAPLSERLPMLAYGSNANPGKIEWLRRQGLSGPAVVITADVDGVAAVWTAGTRVRDEQRPAVLAASPGTVERHAVWFVTPDQRAVLDSVEGRGERYRLAWLKAPIRLSNGERLDRVLAYVARPEVIGKDVEPRLNRSPILVDGHTVRVADVPQDHARELVGEIADSDGLDVIEVYGEPTKAPPGGSQR